VNEMKHLKECFTVKIPTQTFIDGLFL